MRRPGTADFLSIFPDLPATACSPAATPRWQVLTLGWDTGINGLWEIGGCDGLERVKGIEPSYSAWKAAALPLSYTRNRAALRPPVLAQPPPKSDLLQRRCAGFRRGSGGEGWI